MYSGGSLEVVENFCYLGNMLGSEGGVERSVITRVGTAWRKFRELLSLLTSRVLSLQVNGRLYEACVRSVMLYGSETWAVKEEDLDRLDRNDMRMIRWMCNTSLKDRKSSDELRSRLAIHRIRDVIQARRLRWFGHLERMEGDNCVSKCRDLVVPGTKPRGRPRKTWQEVIRTDMRQKNLRPELPQSRSDWKSAINITRPTHTSMENGRLFHFCQETLLHVNLYLGILPIFKSFIHTFEQREPIVHRIYDKQVELVKTLLACFIKPEFIKDITGRKLKGFDLKDKSMQRKLNEI